WLGGVAAREVWVERPGESETHRTAGGVAAGSVQTQYPAVGLGGVAAREVAGVYSPRSVSKGSADPALRAGKYPASSATTINNPPTARNVSGSVAVTP